jgi:hypothetical protein
VFSTVRPSTLVFSTLNFLIREFSILDFSTPYSRPSTLDS